MIQKIKYHVRKIVRDLLKNTASNFNYKIVPKFELRHHRALSFLKDVDYTSKKNFNTYAHKLNENGKLTFNWFVPNLGPGGGGFTVIFRIIRYLESKGHKNRVYVIDDHEAIKDDSLLNFINEHYFDIGDVECFRGTNSMLDCDVLISTFWETAYYAYTLDNTKLKSYLLLDYEPYFYPMGIDYILADKTYDMGYFGLAGGKWLYNTLVKTGRMDGFVFDLGVDFNVYKPLPEVKRDRNALLVYFRSWSSRRGYELIVPTLKMLKKIRPETNILLVGEEDINYKLPFKYTNLGVLKNEELANLYNSISCALVFSLTNHSLLPRELMACGAMVFEIDTPGNREAYEVEKYDQMILVKPNPYEAARQIALYLNNTEERDRFIGKASEYVKQFDWEIELETIEKNILNKFAK